MIDHVSLGTRRYAESVAFYSRVLAPLGMALLRDTGAEAAFGTPERWCFFLYPVPEDEPVTARGVHVALGAPDRIAVAAAAVATPHVDVHDGGTGLLSSADHGAGISVEEVGVICVVLRGCNDGRPGAAVRINLVE